MSAKWQAAIAYTLNERIEGAYSDHPADAGGRTIFGITEKWNAEAFTTVHRLYLSGEREAAKLAAVQWYRRNFWEARPFDAINDTEIAVKCFDMHVNMAFSTAGRIVQKACNRITWDYEVALTEDGHVGALTVGRINDITRRYRDALVGALCGEQYTHYILRGHQNASQRAFWRGWIARSLPPFYLLPKANTATAQPSNIEVYRSLSERIDKAQSIIDKILKTLGERK